MSDIKHLKRATISGFAYRFGERILAQLVSTVITIVLARILIPEDYGVVSLVTILITLCNVLVKSGFSSALIQKKDSDSLDFSTVFWFSLFVSFALYILLCFVSPIVAEYYNQPSLTSILRVLGIRVPLAAINSVQSAYVSKHLLFKKFFWATLIGTVSSGIIGIILAINGAGPWALVIQYLANSTMDTFFLWLFVRWRPHLQFSKDRFKGLFSYGWKILVASLVDEMYEELSSLIIAKEYSTANLSFYTKGRQFPKLLGNNISSTITSVLFPVFSILQDDLATLKKGVRRSISVGSYVLFPVLIGFAIVGESFVRLILTEKWLPAVPYIYIFCVMYLLKPIKNINKNALKSLGKSGLVLIINSLEKAIGIVILILVLKNGVFCIALGVLLGYCFSSLLLAITCGYYIHYTAIEQIRDILPSFILTLLACLPAYFINRLDCAIVPKFIGQVVLSVAIYIITSHFFKVESYIYLRNLLKQLLNSDKTHV